MKKTIKLSGIATALLLSITGCNNSTENTQQVSQSATTQPQQLTQQDAQDFLQEVEAQMTALIIEASRAEWIYQNFITEDTSSLASEQNQRYTEAGVKYAMEAAKFDDVDVTVGTSTSTNYKVPTLEEAFNAARYRHFYALKNDDDEASEKRQQNEILDSGLYDFLGSGSAGKLLTNHLVDRLLQLYYGLLFGLEMGEHTFMYDDAWLDIFVDNDAKQLLQLAEANETTSWWVRNGSVPIGNLIVDGSANLKCNLRLS